MVSTRRNRSRSPSPARKSPPVPVRKSPATKSPARKAPAPKKATPKKAKSAAAIDAGTIVAGCYTGLAAVLDGAAFSATVLLPIGMQSSFDVGIQHALVGYVLMQVVVTYLSGARAMVTGVSYEVLAPAALLAKATKAYLADEGEAAVLATVLAGSALVSVAAAALFYLLSAFKISGEAIAALLPPPLQAGLFAVIGWGIYGLAFEMLQLPPPVLPIAAEDGGDWLATLASPAAYTLWVPTHLLGIALWLASKVTSHPALFPGFVVATVALTHAVRLATGTSLAESAEAGWLMKETEGRSLYDGLWTAASPSAVRWDALFRPEALNIIGGAVLFGPVVNTALNLVLAGPVVGTKLEPPRELRAHAAGSLAAGAAGGFSAYLAVSNTAIHLKCGGTSRASCYAAAAVAALFVALPQLFAVVGYVPTLVVAAICVYIGIDFLYDNLVVAAIGGSRAAAAASYAVAAACVRLGMPAGAALGVAAFQAHAAWAKKKSKKKKA